MLGDKRQNHESEDWDERKMHDTVRIDIIPTWRGLSAEVLQQVFMWRM
jgi:hypothetical protein